MLSLKQMIPNGGHPVFGANGIIGRYDRYNHADTEIVIGCRGSCGSVVITEPKSWITSNAMVVSPREGLTKPFVRYALQAMDIRRAITGVAQPQITRTSLAPLPIRFPVEIQEQQRIVAILDQAFEGIATATTNAEAIVRCSTTLFDQEVTALLDHARLNSTARLGELVEVLDFRRKPVTKSDRVAGPYPYYGATGIVDHVADYLFDERAVLIGEDGAKWGPGERSAFIVDGKYWVNNHAHILRPKPARVMHEWLAYTLNSLDLMPYITGVTVPKLNQAKMRDIELPLPPLDEQARLVATIAKVEEHCTALSTNGRAKLAALAALKQSLLHQAFTGQL